MQITRDHIHYFSCTVCSTGWQDKFKYLPTDCVLIRHRASGYMQEKLHETQVPISMHASCFRLLHAALDAIAADFCTTSFEDARYIIEKDTYSPYTRSACHKCCICNCYGQLDSVSDMHVSFTVSDVTSSAGTRFGIHRSCYINIRHALQSMSAHEVLALLKI